MIKKIILSRFKKFESISINLMSDGISVFAGTNNSGKTSILHALAVWEYAKILLINNRGRKSLNSSSSNRGKGLGITPTDFSPIDMPSLKNLWYNQNSQGSYVMSINVCWDSNIKPEAFLEIAFTLNGNNFAIKNKSSNLQDDEQLPIIAYLPPFAGISSHENRMSLADIRTYIGKGLAGAVIRNLLIDIYNEHKSTIDNLKQGFLKNRKRLSAPQKREIESTVTTWSTLNDILEKTFRIKLIPQEFDDRYHNYINIDVVSKDNQNRRDLMMEGSGFLQWLSVFTFAIDKNNDVLLLDEPDAHLHRSLQAEMIRELKLIAHKFNKQIFLVSHNSELIEYTNYSKVLYVRSTEAAYLKSDKDKVLLLEGLGSDYFPLLSEIKKNKRILFVENDSDWRTLYSLCKASGKTWPSNLVKWVTNKKHSERKHIMIELAQKYFSQSGQRITGYSLRDLDDDNYSTVDSRLIPNGNGEQRDDSSSFAILKYRTFRRRELENYLIIPSAISRYLTNHKRVDTIDTSIAAIEKYLIDEHGIVVPDSYKSSEKDGNTQGLFLLDVKPVLNGLNAYFKIAFSKDEYIDQIEKEEICDDINYIIDELISMCSN